jgi:hypothetical protein
MTKRAVVVGIDDYSAQSNPNFSVGNLAACVADARSMCDLLTDAFLFDEISSFLTNKQASRTAILQATRKMLQASSAGDVACLFYAGHGGRLPVDPSDPSGTRYYECIIPASGAPITDADFLDMADLLEPSEVNFTLIMDSCNSGGLHESAPDSRLRSADYCEDLLQSCIANMDTIIPCGILMPLECTDLDGNVGDVTGDGNGVVCSVDDNKSFVSQSKSTVLAACRYDETDAELTGHGALTQAMIDCINSSNPSATYREFVDELRSDIVNLGLSQTPTLLGQENRMDEVFLEAWNTSA